MKIWLRRCLLGPEEADFEPIGLPLDDDSVEVRGPNDCDASRNCVVASLRPLRLAMARSAGDSSPARSQLRCLDRSGEPADGGAPPEPLGRIELELAESFDVGSAHFDLHAVRRSRSRFVNPLQLHLRSLRARWRRRHSKFNFRMLDRDQHALRVFYMRPRPVELVSVAAEGRYFLFPMDLIGPSASPYFLFALRSTSPAVDRIAESRRVAFAACPIELKDAAYQLGRHHAEATVDLDSLPFPLARSPGFGLPIPAASPRVRELEVTTQRVVGSHTLFFAEIRAQEQRAPSCQLHHVNGASWNKRRDRVDTSRPR